MTDLVILRREQYWNASRWELADSASCHTSRVVGLGAANCSVLKSLILLVHISALGAKRLKAPAPDANRAPGHLHRHVDRLGQSWRLAAYAAALSDRQRLGVRTQHVDQPSPLGEIIHCMCAFPSLRR
jgi:hypothetical protein